MKSEPFTGRSAEMRKATNWLSSEDLMDTGKDEIEVEIAGVFKHKDAKFDDGRTETVYALAFAGKEKQLILNATNRKILVNMFGTTKVADWIGKKVKLYVKDGVRLGKTITRGIRIVDQSPQK